MTGPEHYEAAERLLADAERHNTEHPGDMRIAEICAYTAQVHATLALAAAQDASITQPANTPRHRLTDDFLRAVANVYSDAAIRRNTTRTSRPLPLRDPGVALAEARMVERLQQAIDDYETCAALENRTWKENQS